MSEYDGTELKLDFGADEHKPFKTALHLHMIKCLYQLRNSGKEVPSDLLNCLNGGEISPEKQTRHFTELIDEISLCFTCMAESYQARLDEEGDRLQNDENIFDEEEDGLQNDENALDSRK